MIYEQKYYDNLIKNIPNKFMKFLKKICLRMNNFVISN